ncbi:MAG: hypothetical protein AVDCRST_MAG31-1715, partial [uncultured Sphingomonas sp.]
ACCAYPSAGLTGCCPARRGDRGELAEGRSLRSAEGRAEGARHGHGRCGRHAAGARACARRPAVAARGGMERRARRPAEAGAPPLHRPSPGACSLSDGLGQPVGRAHSGGRPSARARFDRQARFSAAQAAGAWRRGSARAFPVRSAAGSQAARLPGRARASGRRQGRRGDDPQPQSRAQALRGAGGDQHGAGSSPASAGRAEQPQVYPGRRRGGAADHVRGRAAGRQHEGDRRDRPVAHPDDGGLNALRQRQPVLERPARSGRQDHRAPGARGGGAVPRRPPLRGARQLGGRRKGGRSCHRRLESSRGGQGGTAGAAAARWDQLDGRSQVHVAEPLRHLPARHPGQGPVCQGRTAPQQRLRPAGGRPPAGPLGVRRGSGGDQPRRRAAGRPQGAGSRLHHLPDGRAERQPAGVSPGRLRAGPGAACQVRSARPQGQGNRPL